MAVDLHQRRRRLSDPSGCCLFGSLKPTRRPRPHGSLCAEQSPSFFSPAPCACSSLHACGFLAGSSPRTRQLRPCDPAAQQPRGCALDPAHEIPNPLARSRALSVAFVARPSSSSNHHLVLLTFTRPVACRHSVVAVFGESLHPRQPALWPGRVPISTNLRRQAESWWESTPSWRRGALLPGLPERASTAVGRGSSSSADFALNSRYRVDIRIRSGDVRGCVERSVPNSRGNVYRAPRSASPPSARRSSRRLLARRVHHHAF